jgi:hypothetical protein
MLVKERQGAEVLEVYVSPVNPAVSRHVKEFKGYQKVDLQAGENPNVSFRTSKRYSAVTSMRRWVIGCARRVSIDRLVVSSSSELRVGSHHEAPFRVEVSQWWDDVSRLARDLLILMAAGPSVCIEGVRTTSLCARQIRSQTIPRSPSPSQHSPPFLGFPRGTPPNSPTTRRAPLCLH